MSPLRARAGKANDTSQHTAAETRGNRENPVSWVSRVSRPDNCYRYLGCRVGSITVVSPVPLTRFKMIVAFPAPPSSLRASRIYVYRDVKVHSTTTATKGNNKKVTAECIVRTNTTHHVPRHDAGAIPR